jgi:hypothetical protein
MSGSSSDFNALAKVLGEVRGVEDFIFDGLGAIDSEAAGNLGLGCLFFGVVLGLFGRSWCGLFCGHEN